ncbi:hypothetical protein LVY72_22605 [Arthrobacter sp. I2-34]|uniref:Uncharacterized protein n=1 Tax=Arthrobacter hankyongi TaxID=2904801 RepID=A0ABS9LDD3_9MICC|nr:hypothetical protein [Arthrobacter hankyongi]MCG2624685.1 hypothetical protein [Arthrobacter hankyongi]
MSKVDPSSARRLIDTTPRWHPDFERYLVTRAPYMREPYVRAQLEAGPVNAKAIGWTREHVHTKWPDADFQVHTRWVPASWVKRISREKSSWQDPYDVHDKAGARWQ